MIVRQAVLQQEVDYLLEVGASGEYGFIDADMVAASQLRLAQYGMQPDQLEYEVSTTSGADGTDKTQPLLRGVGLGLRLSYPVEGLFEIDRLIGLTPPPADMRISARGLKMSEYVP